MYEEIPVYNWNKKSHLPDVIYFLLTAWRHPSGFTSMCMSPTLITLLPSLHSAPGSPLLRPPCASGPLPAAFWTCLLFAFSLVSVSCCTMDAARRWSRKGLLSPSTLWLSARCIEQPDLQWPPFSLNPPFPGSISGAITAAEWLTATSLSLSSWEKCFARTCFLCSRTLFNWLHNDLAPLLLTAQTDTCPHPLSSAGSVKGSADSYPPLMVSPRWLLPMWFHKNVVSSLHLVMLCLPYHWFNTVGMVCRLVLAVVSAQVLSCPEQQQILVCLVSMWSGPVPVPIFSSLIASFYFSLGFISSYLAS